MKRQMDVEAEIAEALRCTTHIPERDIRAMYIWATLKLDGFVIQRAHRDPRGRFAAPTEEERQHDQ